jgi:hypothetical protein
LKEGLALNDKQTWDNIEALVLKFQSGDEAAGVELLNKFTNYFNKFSNIIKNTNVNLSDRESRFFISLFLQKDDYANMRRPFHSSETIAKGLQVMSFISSDEFKKYAVEILHDIFIWD